MSGVEDEGVPHVLDPTITLAHVEDCPGCLDWVRRVNEAAPAQGLDAATIERCAQVAEKQRYTHKHPSAGMDHEMEMHDDGCAADATAIRALNTASTTTRGEDTRLREALEEKLSAARARNPHETFSDEAGAWNEGFSECWMTARAALQADAAHTSQEKGNG